MRTTIRGSLGEGVLGRVEAGGGAAGGAEAGGVEAGGGGSAGDKSGRDGLGRRGFLRTVGGTAAGLAAPAVIRSARAAAPFFKLYLMIPNNQPARMIWGTLAAQQMSKLGIDVISSYVDFPI